MEISQAFDLLLIPNQIEKAVRRGETKKNNPKYRKAIGRNGRIKYVLANKDEVGAKVPKELTEEQFEAMRTDGKAERHFDEPPTVRDVDDLEHMSFLSTRSVDTIKRSLARVEFYKKSIPFARAIGRKDTEEGHNRSMQADFHVIDTLVTRDFNNMGSVLFNEDTVQQLKELNCIVVGGDKPEHQDFMNNNFEHFDVVKLAGDIKKNLSDFKGKLQEMGIPTEKWVPKTHISFFPTGFTVEVKNNDDVVTDKFGFKNNLAVSLKRTFSAGAGSKNVYHDYLFLGQKDTPATEINPLRGGFAKNIMKSFYEQYKKGGLNGIRVSAASAGNPYNGTNTWGRWGFTIKKDTMDGLIRQAFSKYQNPIKELVDEFIIDHKDKDDVSTMKKNENGEWVKVQYVAGDYNDESDNNRKCECIIVTKKSEDGEYRSKVKVLKHIDKRDIEKIKKVFDAKVATNPSDDRFRFKSIYDNCKNDILRGVFKNISMWSGEVNLKDDKQRLDFEKNLYKRYDKPPKIEKEEESEE